MLSAIAGLAQSAMKMATDIRLLANFKEMEEPFEWIIEFRPRTAAADAQGVWWRLSKDKRPQSFPAELGIAPANILLLY